MSTTITLQALEAAMSARIPTMIVGAPGVGKTATIRAIAKRMGYSLITLVGSQLEPTDIMGLPHGGTIRDTETGEETPATVYLAPDWQAKILQQKKVILFLDEFSNTPASTRASMLTLLQNREFPNGRQMPKETIVIGAMNPTDDAADGWELDKPTTNRIMWLNWQSTVDSWFEGMLTAWDEPVSRAELNWRRIIVNFLRDNPSYLHAEPKSEDMGSPEAYGISAGVASNSELEVARYAWSSRRSWDNTARALAFVPEVKNDLGEDISGIVQDEIISGLVGRVSGQAFREYIRKSSVFNPHDVLADPEIVDWASISVSEANIILKAISDKEFITAENWDRVPELLKVIHNADRANLAGAYVRDYVTNVTKAAATVGKRDEAKEIMVAILKLGFGTKKPAEAPAA